MALVVLLSEDLWKRLPRGLKWGKHGTADAQKNAGNPALFRFATLNGVQLRNSLKTLFTSLYFVCTYIKMAPEPLFAPAAVFPW